TVEEAIALSVPMPVISASLFARFASRQQSSPTMQAVAALRGGFGGHQVMTIAEGQKLREGAVPTRSAKKESAPSQAKKRASAKKASSESAAVASKANVGAARKAATSKRAPATKATDMADTAQGQARAAKTAPARKSAKRAAKKA
ncbi:MAG: 6-phosphogluconate dehydrogenase, partial [Terracoccus sp.]